MKDGDVAGLTAFQKIYGFVGVKRTGSDKTMVAVSIESDSPVETGSVKLEEDLVFLKIDSDFRANADKAYFYYSLDGQKWTQIGKPLQMRYTLPHFMGYRFGLFNFATKAAGGMVDFDYLRISDQIELHD